jgi:hypothetical protein
MDPVAHHDQTVDTNVTKQQANLRTVQTAAAALEGNKKEKRKLIEGCGTDMQRPERGIAFQQSTKESASGKTAIEESMRPPWTRDATHSLRACSRTCRN